MILSSPGQVETCLPVHTFLIIVPVKEERIDKHITRVGEEAKAKTGKIQSGGLTEKRNICYTALNR